MIRVLVAVSLLIGCLSTSSVAQQPPGCEGRTLATQGVTLFYQLCGEGTPLLLLHGFQNSGTATWSQVIPRLATKWRLIIPDLRGHGRSTNPSGVFTHRQAAKDMFAVLDSLALKSVQAMGVSSGGMTLLHMATDQRARIERMVLIGATTYFPEQARQIMRTANADSITPQQLEVLRRRHAHGDEQIRSIVSQFNAFQNSYDDVNFTPPYLSTITAPTLIVHGDRDVFFPVDIAIQMYTSIPRAYLWIVPNGGHVPINDHLEEFVVKTMGFLSGAWDSTNRP